MSREMLIHITNEIRSMEETDLIILWDKRIEKNQLIVGKVKKPIFYIFLVAGEIKCKEMLCVL